MGNLTSDSIDSTKNPDFSKSSLNKFLYWINGRKQSLAYLGSYFLKKKYNMAESILWFSCIPLLCSWSDEVDLCLCWLFILILPKWSKFFWDILENKTLFQNLG